MYEERMRYYFVFMIYKTKLAYNDFKSYNRRVSNFSEFIKN